MDCTAVHRGPCRVVPGRIPEEVIAEVRERTDIVQVIGQHVELKRSGVNHKGRCPFHDEKTASFNVNSQRQFYHCFGCHESGDVFRFLMKIEGRSFTEVVEDLAGRAGVEIPRVHLSPRQAQEVVRRRSDRQQALDLNQRVAELYRSLLGEADGVAAQRYLEERGIGAQVAEAFLIGHAPHTGDAVVRMLSRAERGGEDSELEFAEKVGLVARRTGRQGYHDRFWNRLIFPVVGAGGEVLGFGGRLLGDGDGPKYINTPETFLYRKGDALYGLFVAAKAIRQQGSAILVEGNFDVLQMHQHGFENTVAPMGTALTERQVLLLRRFAREAVGLFDGDDAGQAAALKAVPLLVAAGVDGKIATLPHGMDPDDFLRQQGSESMQRLLQRAQPAVEFMIDSLRHRMDNTIPSRARVLEQVAPVLARIPSQAEQDLYIGRLALDLKIDQAVVRRAVGAGQTGQIRGQQLQQGFQSGGPGGRSGQASSSAARPSQQRKQPIFKGEFDVLAILVEHPHLVPRAEQANLSGLLTNDGLRATYRAAVQLQQISGQIDPVKLFEAAPEDLRGSIAENVMSGAFASVGDATRALDDSLQTLRRRQLEFQRQEIRKEMATARSEGNTESELRLAGRMIEVEREIHETR